MAYANLPGLNYLRVPARFLFLYSFAGAALGAIGLQELLRASWKRQMCVLGALIALWVAVGVWGARAVSRDTTVERLAPQGSTASSDKRWTLIQLLRLSQSEGGLPGYYNRLYLKTIALAGASILSILVAGRHPKWGGPVLATFLCVDLVDFSRGMSPWALAGVSKDHLLTPTWAGDTTPSMFRYKLPPLLFHPNRAMLHRLPVMEGYDPFLPQARHTDLTTARDSNNLAYQHRLAQLFAVAYEAQLEPSKLSPSQPHFVPREAITVSQNPDVPPRARLVPYSEFAADGPQALKRVLDNDFDPWQTVVIEESSQSEATSSSRQVTDRPTELNSKESTAASEQGTTRESNRESPGAVLWKADEPERLQLEVDASHACWLLISDAYWPAWSARVNGNEVPIRRANYYFRAVAVPQGRSVVEMRYTERSVWLGACISLVSVGGIVATFVIRGRRRGAPKS
jgi:hypothetical protein